VQSIVYEEDFQYDEGSQEAIDSNNQVKVMVRTLEDLRQNPQGEQGRRLHLHFFANPTEVIGEDGKVKALRVERTKLDGKGGVTNTGEFKDFPVQAVYRAVGYFGSELSQIPFDHKLGVIRNSEGRVLDGTGNHIPGVYATGWIKRGPVGLIGHTKADAIETIGHVIADRYTWWQPSAPAESEIVQTLEARGVRYIRWDHWLKIDQAERALGEPQSRERVKLFEREEMLSIGRGE
jgi:ferredoxin--NADP+ reductase